MQSISILSILLVVLSAFPIAHNGEDHNLLSAISVSLQTVSGATGTVVIIQASDLTLTTTIQPAPTGSALSSAISFLDSILTDSLASPTPATSSITVSRTTSSTTAVVLASTTSVSSETATPVSQLMSPPPHLPSLAHRLRRLLSRPRLLLVRHQLSLLDLENFWCSCWFSGGFVTAFRDWFSSRSPTAPVTLD
ncbi:hypothetical protein BKA65DRAFT_554686 [Rhexocercosporidium sp. MPI-PUGE-AT-0058]|nr:hypothetical protein BKA65DRAFT_554686 [Rhexocercosporidium sp. MPI-PUGE-AT-0058]